MHERPLILSIDGNQISAGLGGDIVPRHKTINSDFSIAIRECITALNYPISNETPVCVSQTIKESDAIRELICKILYTDFGFHYVTLCVGSFVAALAYGLDTCLLVDIGLHSTYICPLICGRTHAYYAETIPTGNMNWSRPCYRSNIHEIMNQTAHSLSETSKNRKLLKNFYEDDCDFDAPYELINSSNANEICIEAGLIGVIKRVLDRCGKANSGELSARVLITDPHAYISDIFTTEASSQGLELQILVANNGRNLAFQGASILATQESYDWFKLDDSKFECVSIKSASTYMDCWNQWKSDYILSRIQEFKNDSITYQPSKKANPTKMKLADENNQIFNSNNVLWNINNIYGKRVAKKKPYNQIVPLSKQFFRLYKSYNKDNFQYLKMDYKRKLVSIKKPTLDYYIKNNLSRERHSFNEKSLYFNVSVNNTTEISQFADVSKDIEYIVTNPSIPDNITHCRRYISSHKLKQYFSAWSLTEYQEEMHGLDIAIDFLSRIGALFLALETLEQTECYKVQEIFECGVEYSKLYADTVELFTKERIPIIRTLQETQLRLRKFLYYKYTSEKKPLCNSRGLFIKSNKLIGGCPFFFTHNFSSSNKSGYLQKNCDILYASSTNKKKYKTKFYLSQRIARSRIYCNHYRNKRLSFQRLNTPRNHIKYFKYHIISNNEFSKKKFPIPYFSHLKDNSTNNSLNDMIFANTSDTNSIGYEQNYRQGTSEFRSWDDHIISLSTLKPIKSQTLIYYLWLCNNKLLSKIGDQSTSTDKSSLINCLSNINFNEFDYLYLLSYRLLNHNKAKKDTFISSRNFASENCNDFVLKQHRNLIRSKNNLYISKIKSIKNFNKLYSKESGYFDKYLDMFPIKNLEQTGQNHRNKTHINLKSYKKGYPNSIYNSEKILNEYKKRITLLTNKKYNNYIPNINNNSTRSPLPNFITLNKDTNNIKFGSENISTKDNKKIENNCETLDLLDNTISVLLRYSIILNSTDMKPINKAEPGILILRVPESRNLAAQQHKQRNLPKLLIPPITSEKLKETYRSSAKRRTYCSSNSSANSKVERTDYTISALQEHELKSKYTLHKIFKDALDIRKALRNIGIRAILSESLRPFVWKTDIMGVPPYAHTAFQRLYNEDGKLILQDINNSNNSKTTEFKSKPMPQDCSIYVSSSEYKLFGTKRLSAQICTRL